MNKICKTCQHQKIGGIGSLICGKAPSESNAHGDFVLGSNCIYDSDLSDHYLPISGEHNNLEDAKATITMLKDELSSFRYDNSVLMDRLTRVDGEVK